ncbi:hypothetical protein NLG97_g9328 [Lecanicillium saksenae]|uniref:Uncharacterized protein n=1 Tax=Lecanicillium saksenae TaxID=468837 RepID=A0ACC1QJQ2_9HYPO|nr:hypothetical protein NLG97_g9328 [Lecanicillium saksenae]
MDLDKQHDVPTLASRVASLRKRVAAKLETNPTLARITGRNKGVQKSQISRPELFSSSLHLPDPSVPCDSNIPSPPTPLHPDTFSFDPIAPFPHDRRPWVPGCIINRGARSQNWSHATSATLEMVRETEELDDSDPRLTRGQEVYRETRDIQRNRIVRYNEREGRLQLLSRAEQDRL